MKWFDQRALTTSLTFSQHDIAKIIQNSDSSIVYCHDNMSMRMLKIWGPAIFRPLAVIFKQCLDTGFSHLVAKSLGLFKNIRAYIWYNQKREIESSKRAHFRIFTSHFPKFWTFRTLQPPKRHVLFKFLVEKKAFHFSKRHYVRVPHVVIG